MASSPAVDAVDIASAIARSFRRGLGYDLVPEAGGPDVASAEAIARAMMQSPSIILCHDAAEDPVFIYANRSAARLWRLSLDAMIGMPSRLSAPPEHRQERAGTLARAAETGVVRGYSGERIAADGQRFLIQDAIVWSVDLPDGSTGQAATFDTWRIVDDAPLPEDGESIR